MPYGLENRDGKRIGDLKAWGELAKPASTTHWKEGRSAMELARAWTTGSGAIDLSALLERARATSGFLPERAIAEAQTAFDSFRGGRRNHDLLVIGRATAGRRRGYRQCLRHIFGRGRRIDMRLRVRRRSGPARHGRGVKNAQSLLTGDRTR